MIALNSCQFFSWIARFSRRSMSANFRFRSCHWLSLSEASRLCDWFQNEGKCLISTLCSSRLNIYTTQRLLVAWDNHIVSLSYSSLYLRKQLVQRALPVFGIWKLAVAQQKHRFDVETLQIAQILGVSDFLEQSNEIFHLVPAAE